MNRLAGMDWCVKGRPLAGQERNGDASLTWEAPGLLRVAVIDGLGHGDEAALASRLACETLAGLSQAPLNGLLAALHAALQRTRGAAVALAEADLRAGRWSWCGVGNIAGLLLPPPGQGKPERLICRSGIVGAGRLPELLLRSTDLLPGSLALLHTDGLCDLYGQEAVGPEEALAPTTSRLLDGHARSDDDALLWLGRAYAR